ncbi:HAD family hydrolase [bacterium]|nr:HAD family hydrolase [bacterium]
MENIKKVILIDLDGVLNSYRGEYNENYIEPVTVEAFQFIKDLSNEYRILIFTSRNLDLAAKWVKENNLENYVESVTNIKKPSYLIIDDRCITFDGKFSDLKNKINNFKVWYKN